MLDVDQHIASRIASRSGNAVHAHGDAGCGRRIIGGVDTCPAIEQIGAGAAHQRVVAITAHQRVVAETAIDQVIAATAFKRLRNRRAVDCVVERRADHVLDTGQDIALRIPADTRRAIEIDIDGAGTGRIVHRIGARAAA